MGISLKTSVRAALVFAVMVLSITTTAAFSQTQIDASKIRIVDADAQVQSRKRGVCINKFSGDDFRAIAPGVSWYYNWHYKTDDVPPKGVNVEFLPMVWGDSQDRLDGFEAYLKAGHKPRAVLAINEPNLKEQAFIPPKQTADLYMRIKKIADRYNVPTVGPHMALGSATNDSIKAYDPIEKKDVTYTFMIPFLKGFETYLDPKDVSASALHAYGHLGELHWAVGLMHKEFDQKPVWVTEYAQWSTPNEAAAVRYLIQSTDFLERTPYVEGYAWFKERANNNPRISLFNRKSGELSALGKAYVSLPVHDADLYYRLPGRLNAARYVTMDNAEIEPASDAGGFVEMVAQKGDAALNYNVVVAKAGKYSLSLRAKGKGDFTITAAGKGVASGTVASNGWTTIAHDVTLSAGPQMIKLELGEKGQAVHWIELKAK